MAARRGTDDTDGREKPARKQISVGTTDDATFRGYINVNLSDDQKERLEEWLGAGGFEEWLAAEVEAGVNLSLKRERKSGGYLASGTQRDPESPNAGLCVTARARTPLTALHRLLFTLMFLDTGGIWENTAPLAGGDRW